MISGSIQRSDKSTYVDKSETLLVGNDIWEKYFNYPDTHSSRSTTNIINYGVCKQKIAIIGLGGTGAYILDLLAKNPIDQIHIYDADFYETHNAFRSPGAISAEDLNKRQKKIQYYEEIYSRINKRIHAHEYNMDSEKLSELDDKDFVFVCIDNQKDRLGIIGHLLDQNIPFIDVGISVAIHQNKLRGSARVRIVEKDKSSGIKAENIVGETPAGEEVYDTNIQTAELNAINACLAIIHWKQLSGIYHKDNETSNLIYEVDSAIIRNDSNKTT